MFFVLRVMAFLLGIEVAQFGEGRPPYVIVWMRLTDKDGKKVGKWTVCSAFGPVQACDTRAQAKLAMAEIIAQETDRL